MIFRFCLYSIFKNLRFADPFNLLYLIHLDLSLKEVGFFFGYQHILTALLEVPLGFVADRFGRRSSLIACFFFYTLCFVAFPLAGSVEGANRFGVIAIAMTLFGIAEALRTGSHKAIILDHLDSTGQSDRATEVIGFTRLFSKTSSGLAALGGGLILLFGGGFEFLFWASAAAAFGGLIVVAGYPKSLEGESHRSREKGQRRTWREDLAAIRGEAGGLRVFLQSIFFESQIKVLLKYTLQPFMAQGFSAFGLTLLPRDGGASSALWMGSAEFIRDGLGGLAARQSSRVERAAGGASTALKRCYLTALACAFLLLFCSLDPKIGLPIGFLLLVVLTVLQNVRRPIFVAYFNRFMDKSQRATVLSIESQVRAIVVGTTLPLIGWAADVWGIAAAFISSASLLAVGAILTFRPR